MGDLKKKKKEAACDVTYITGQGEEIVIENEGLTDVETYTINKLKEYMRLFYKEQLEKEKKEDTGKTEEE